MRMSSQAHISRGRLNNSCANSAVTVFPPAKLNLYLNITGLYQDGFHKITSIVNRISLFDTIRIKTNNCGKIRFGCSDKTLDNKDNLCFRAAQLLRKTYDFKRGLDIHLTKNIPIGSGLGGASSDAASILCAINSLLRLEIPQRELLDLGKKLGSDVNFFLHDISWGLLTGKGDEVIPLDISTKVKYIVVYPRLVLSTRLVYKKTTAKLTKFLDNVNILCHALKEQDYHLVERVSFNCLEKSALEVCRKLKNVEEFFRRQGLFCQLTGSGSAFFAFSNSIKNKAEKNILLRKIRKQRWAVFEVQTF